VDAHAMPPTHTPTPTPLWEAAINLLEEPPHELPMDAALSDDCGEVTGEEWLSDADSLSGGESKASCASMDSLEDVAPTGVIPESHFEAFAPHDPEDEGGAAGSVLHPVPPLATGVSGSGSSTGPTGGLEELAEIPDESQITRDRAAHVVFVDGGRLAFYGGKQHNATAQCNNPSHGKCVLTRKMTSGRKPGQGRPLGLLAAWLASGAEMSSKEEHWALPAWPTLAARKTARAALKALDTPDVRGLLASERAQLSGEESEPDEID
jgi:hypothetical protein